MNPDLNAVIEVIEEDHPELMRALYPRVYNDIGRYHSPRAIAGHLAGEVFRGMAARGAYNQMPVATRLLLNGLRYLIQHRMPMFFLAPDLLEAVKRSDFKEEINWLEFPLPYEAGILVLPRGAFSHPTDGEVGCIIWARMRKGVHPPPWDGFPEIDRQNNAFAWVALCGDKGIWYDSTATDMYRPVLRVDNFFYAAPEGKPLNYPEGQSTLVDHDLEEIDKPFVQQVSTILWGSLLVLMSRPSILTPAKLERRIEKHKGKRIEFWSPNILGRDYRLPRPAAGEGTHASPRMHWRRGHFRNQAFGAGLAERKVIWIEPVLVAAETTSPRG